MVKMKVRYSCVFAEDGNLAIFANLPDQQELMFQRTRGPGTRDQGIRGPGDQGTQHEPVFMMVTPPGLRA